MDPSAAVDVAREAVNTVLILCAPVLAVAILTGVVIGLMQAVTQIHDSSILFAIRAVATGFVLAISLPWLIEHYTSYAQELWQRSPIGQHAETPR